MPFTFDEFPHTRNYDSDLRELIAEVRELIKSVNDISEEILKEAKEYTDDQLAGYQEQVDAIKRELESEMSSLNDAFNLLKASVNVSIGIINDNIDSLHDEMVADIAAVNARTDLAIEQNNEYILSEVGRFLSQIKVLNYFTGEYITIQEMFDYLAKLHATDGITVAELASREKTVNELIALNMTMTQLAMNGKNIIPA
jgi:ElaB/YqjD/DUF883 family membrane-anchored ribosome-binding protein